MKCIYPDNITSLTADEEDAEYPVENLQNNHPKKVWKGESRDATITAIVSGGGAAAVIATNATSVSLNLSSGQTLVWDTGIAWAAGIAWDTSGDSDVTDLELLPGDISGCAWFDFAARSGSFTAILELTAEAGDTIQAGIVRIGTCNEFNDPKYGLKEGLKDYSIVKELNNGATYIRKRDVVRSFQGDLFADRDTAFYEFLLDVGREIGPLPIAWRIVQGVEDSEWIAFCRFDQMPLGGHGLPYDCGINFSLLEVL